MIEPAFALGIKLPEKTEFDSELEYTPFPIETFPLAVQEFCEDVGRVTQAPIEFSASLCLGVLSACLGKGVVIPNAFTLNDSWFAGRNAYEWNEMTLYKMLDITCGSAE